MKEDVISSVLKAVLRRLKLSRILDTLPERLVLARQQKMPHQDLLLLAPQDEVSRRDSQAAVPRAREPHLETFAQLENWDETAKVSFDRALLNELASLRFLDSHHHLLIVGPVGVGKSCLAHALGYIACRRPRGRVLQEPPQARLRRRGKGAHQQCHAIRGLWTLTGCG